MLTSFTWRVTTWYHLSSTWLEFDPNTAYVVCISICTGFSLYGIHMPLFSSYGIHMPLFPYMVIQSIVLGMALLWTLHCPKDSYCDLTMIWPFLFHGIRVAVSKTSDNALSTQMHGDYRLSIDRIFVGFIAICSTFLLNNPIYIEGHNCWLRSQRLRRTCGPPCGR